MSWVTEGETGNGELLKEGLGEVKAAGIRVEAAEREGEASQGLLEVTLTGWGGAKLGAGGPDGETKGGRPPNRTRVQSCR